MIQTIMFNQRDLSTSSPIVFYKGTQEAVTHVTGGRCHAVIVQADGGHLSTRAPIVRHQFER
jgi:ribosomal protein S27E